MDDELERLAREVELLLIGNSGMVDSYTWDNRTRSDGPVLVSRNKSKKWATTNGYSLDRYDGPASIEYVREWLFGDYNQTTRMKVWASLRGLDLDDLSEEEILMIQVECVG